MALDRLAKAGKLPHRPTMQSVQRDRRHLPLTRMRLPRCMKKLVDSLRESLENSEVRRLVIQ